jgi:hypothetical protein
MKGLDKSVVGVLLLACLVTACDDTTTPVTPTPEPKTETFTGTVSQAGGDTHNFDVGAGGRVTATLKSLAPDSALVVGFGLGNWNSTVESCSIVLAKDAATTNAVLTGTMTSAGPLCVRVYDVGNIGATPVTYSVEVTHP